METFKQHHFDHVATPIVFPKTITIGQAVERNIAKRMAWGQAETGTVYTYTPANGTTASIDYTATVNGSPCFVYPSPASTIKIGAYTYFDFEGGFAHLVITVPSTVTVSTAVIRPLALGVVPTITDAHTISMVLDPADAPANMCLEVNGDADNPLWIFAGAKETFPSPSDPSVAYYYHQGVTYDPPASGTVNGISAVGEIIVPAGKTVVVEGGAIVHGRIRIGAGSSTGTGSTGCKVVGRGVVDATNTLQSGTYGRPMKIYKGTNVLVNGPIFLGRQTWAFRIFGSSNVTVNNAKVLNGATATSSTPDGMDILASSNVTVTGCLIRSIDDGIAIKNEKDNFDGTWTGDVDSVTINDCVISQGPNGNALEIGWETGGYVDAVPHTVSNVFYNRIHVIRKIAKDTASRRGALGIHNADGTNAHPGVGYGTVTGIRYTDCVVERSQQAIVQFWCSSSGDTINDVYVKNLTVLDTQGLPSYIEGQTSGLIGGNTAVTFENWLQNGVRVLSAGDGNVTQTNATVAYIPPATGTPIGTSVVDAWVQNGGTAPTSDGAGTGLWVKGSSSTSVQKQAFLRFDMSASGLASVSSATLRLWCVSRDTAVTVPVTAYAITSAETWAETITWATKPTLGTAQSTTNVTGTGQWFAFDVTAAVNAKLTGAKLVSFALYDASLANVKVVFSSREASVNRPQLVLTA